ncbi:hypothetical protein B484DRAFT_452847 [Ochromonadaceae sp. CCMP2298]|nr:hypothetical protein B484DRAFT_452847 [Ochromonadaceae sp. CCMP2298]
MGGGGGMGGGMGVGVGAGGGGSGAGWRIGNEWGTDRHYAESGGGGEYGASSLPLLLGNSFTSPTRTRDRASLGLGDLGSAGSSGAYSTGEHATPTPPTPQLLRMARLQHENLYPDRRIDRLPDGGVTDFRAGVGGQAAVNLVSSLHQIDVNLKETQSWLAKYIDQRLAKLRTYCNLPQPPHPHRKHSARLGACMHSMVRIVPSSAAGMTTSVARGVEGEQRDLSGRLTEVGKACIVGGTVRVRVRDVLQPRALARDPLECPLCSYEWKPLALLMVALTRDLNHTMHLPRNDAYLMCSWYTVWRNAHAASRGWFPFAPVFADCFRLNLRPLARYRVFAPLLLWIACVLRRFGVLSTSLLLLLSAPLSYLMFENNFPQ